MTSVSEGVRPAAVTTFALPPEQSAGEPPEARGLARDEVRLLVAGHGPVRHTLFHNLATFLHPGDLIVVNTSATMPAAVDGRRADGTPIAVHVSGPAPQGGWIVELRRLGHGRVSDGRAGEVVDLPGGVQARLVTAHPNASAATSRLWRARIDAPHGVPAYLGSVGRPITYDYVKGHWPLRSYQTIFAREPGSAEMPSAGRPFSHRLLLQLAISGVAVQPLTLHTGVSSLEADEEPQPERFVVPAATAAMVNAARASGGRIVAVGTTVTRALETVAARDGTVTAGEGWTDLVLGPDRPARVVNGLVTGWHEPGASHLLLLEAVAGTRLVAEAYEAALEARYRWHEFGDACLLLPGAAGLPQL